MKLGDVPELSASTQALNAILTLEVEDERFQTAHPEVTFSPHFVASVPELLRNGDVSLRTVSLTDFKALAAELSDKAEALSLQRKWQQVGGLLQCLNQLYREAELGADEATARSYLHARLDSFARRIFNGGERRGRLNSAAALCAQLAVWISEHPGQDYSVAPQASPRDPIAYEHRDSRLQRYAQDPAIVDELYCGAARWAAARSLVAVEHLARLRSGQQHLISTRLLDQAIKGGSGQASIVEGTEDSQAREAIRKMACGLYQLVRSPTLKESSSTGFQDASEQVHAAHFVHLLLGVRTDWDTQLERSRRERESGSVATILPMLDVSRLNSRIAQSASSAWEHADYEQSARQACEGFRAACREFVGSGDQPNDIALIKMVAKRLQATGVSYHRAWGDLAIGVLEAIQKPTRVMLDNQHASFAALCMLSQLVEKLPNGQTAARSNSTSGGTPVTAEIEKLSEFQELLNWFGAQVKVVGLAEVPARFRWDYAQVSALARGGSEQTKGMPGSRQDALDDVLQALCFFMRDLPAHHLHESGPDCAVIDYRICSSFAYQLCGYADAAACAQKQRVPSSPQSLREYASLLHPHLAVQIGAHLLEGNLDAAAQAALELLRDLSTNLPEDRRDESGAPIDLRTHYLRRLVSGTLAYFNDSAAQQGYNLQIVAMVNQALGVAEPEAVSVRDLGDPKTDKMVLLAVTHEIIRRVERDSLHVEKMLKSPRPERPSRDTPPVLETPESD